MTAPRLAPLEPPYAPEAAAAIAEVMGSGRDPLVLFKTLARVPRVLARLRGGGFLDKGPVSLRHREIAILRTTGRLDCEYEWGVHVAIFGKKAGLSAEEVEATVLGGADAPAWKAQGDKLVIRLCDSLVDRHDIDDALWRDLAAEFQEAALLELIAIAGNYTGISCLVKALRLPPEAFAPRFPRVA